MFNGILRMKKLNDKKFYPETTGALKNSIPNNSLELAIKWHAYKTAHDYKDKEFPQPLEKRRAKKC